MATKEQEYKPPKQKVVKQKKKSATMQGRFIPKRPEKYVGNPNAIFFRSSWEYRFMMWCDTTQSILKWASEEIAIPYVNPIKKDLQGRNKISNYFPDFIIMVRQPDGNVVKTIVEIKPRKESVLTEKSSDRDRMAYVQNQAKWAAARAYAARNNATFEVVTEDQLFWKPPKQTRKK